MFELSERSGGRALQVFGQFLIGSLCNQALNCSQETTRAFIEAVAKNYYDHPYHNGLHAIQVCHSSCWLTRSLKIEALQTTIERAGFAIAALCHDIKHTGRNNGFCVNTEHPLALLYNNASVLENMHAATCWNLLQSHVSMLQTLSRSDRAALRGQIIGYILATDMSEHFEVLSKFRVRMENPEFSMENPSDRQLTARMCIKAGDIGHSALPWDPHERWSIRCVREFLQQGDEERSLGLPISPLCDRSTVADIGKSQKGFLEFVCLPLFDSLSEQEDQMSRPSGSTFSVDSHHTGRTFVSMNTRSSYEQMASESPCRDSLRSRNVHRFCIRELRANARRWVEEEEVVEKIQAQLKSF